MAKSVGLAWDYKRERNLPILQGACAPLIPDFATVPAETRTRNLLESGHPLVTFDDTRKKFLRRGIEGQLEELENSHQLALVQKVVVDGAVAIMAFGFGEVGTVAAVNHLAHEWRTLARQYGHRPFARLMLVHANGRLSIQEDLVDQVG